MRRLTDGATGNQYLTGLTLYFEGGWKLPFHDSDEKKRGGIQVDDVGPVAELDGA